MASLSGTLYVGMTDNLPKRVYQHRSGSFDGFTKRYAIHRLVFFECQGDAQAAACRERQFKKLSRAKKMALIANSNPDWKDLTPGLQVWL